MLIIRNEQIQQFIASGEDELALMVARCVREANPERVSAYDDAALESMVKLGIERARSHELIAAEDIAAFVSVMFAVAPRFDEQPEIGQVLSDPQFPAGMRFYQIFDRVADEAWAKAEKKYENSFWLPDATE